MAVFDGNGEIVNDILTLAYFPITTDYAYRRKIHDGKHVRNYYAGLSGKAQTIFQIWR